MRLHSEGRGWLLPAVIVLLTTAVGAVTDILTGILPDGWRWARDLPLMGAALGVLTGALTYSAVLQYRRGTPAGPTKAPGTVHHRAAGAAGPVTVDVEGRPGMPAGLGQGPYDHRTTEIFDHNLPGFVGRGPEIEQLCRFVQAEAGGYVLVEAPPGYGKTALAARFLHDLRTNVRRGPRVVYYFVREVGQQHLAETYLGEVNGQLRALLGPDDPASGRSGEQQPEVAQLWHLAAARATQDRPLVLLVDGLDESDVAGTRITSVLPAEVPKYVHVIVTSRPRPDPRRFVPPDHPLRHAQVLALGGLTEADVALLLGDRYAAMAARVFQATGGEPLFARYLCEDIRSLGETALSRFEGASVNGVRQYFQWQIKQIAANTGDGAAGDVITAVLGTLCVAAGPVTPADLVGMLATPVAEVTAALTAIERYLIGSSAVQLIHPELRGALTESLTVTGLDLPTRERRILAWCEWFRQADWPDETPDYVWSYYVTHLRRAGEPGRVYGLLQQHWVARRLARQGNPGSLREDLRSIIGQASAERRFPEMLRAIHIRTSIRSFQVWPPRSSLAVLAAAGHVDSALGFAALTAGGGERGRAFEQIGRALIPQRGFADALRAMRLAVHAGAEETFASEAVRVLVSCAGGYCAIALAAGEEHTAVRSVALRSAVDAARLALDAAQEVKDDDPEWGPRFFSEPALANSTFALADVAGAYLAAGRPDLGAELAAEVLGLLRTMANQGYPLQGTPFPTASAGHVLALIWWRGRTEDLACLTQLAEENGWPPDVFQNAGRDLTRTGHLKRALQLAKARDVPSWDVAAGILIELAVQRATAPSAWRRSSLRKTVRAALLPSYAVEAACVQLIEEGAPSEASTVLGLLRDGSDDWLVPATAAMAAAGATALGHSLAQCIVAAVRRRSRRSHRDLAPIADSLCRAGHHAECRMVLSRMTGGPDRLPEQEAMADKAWLPFLRWAITAGPPGSAPGVFTKVLEWISAHGTVDERLEHLVALVDACRGRPEHAAFTPAAADLCWNVVRPGLADGSLTADGAARAVHVLATAGGHERIRLITDDAGSAWNGPELLTTAAITAAAWARPPADTVPLMREAFAARDPEFALSISRVLHRYCRIGDTDAAGEFLAASGMTTEAADRHLALVAHWLTDEHPMHATAAAAMIHANADRSMAMTKVAGAVAAKGDMIAAERLCDQAVSTLGERRADIASSEALALAGDCMRRLGRLTAAERLAREAITVSQAVEGEPQRLTALAAGAVTAVQPDSVGAVLDILNSLPIPPDLLAVITEVTREHPRQAIMTAAPLLQRLRTAVPPPPAESPQLTALTSELLLLKGDRTAAQASATESLRLASALDSTLWRHRVTFASVCRACASAGMVEEAAVAFGIVAATESGMRYFDDALRTSAEILVPALARAGRPAEAADLMRWLCEEERLRREQWCGILADAGLPDAALALAHGAEDDRTLTACVLSIMERSVRHPDAPPGRGSEALLAVLPRPAAGSPDDVKVAVVQAFAEAGKLRRAVNMALALQAPAHLRTATWITIAKVMCRTGDYGGAVTTWEKVEPFGPGVAWSMLDACGEVAEALADGGRVMAGRAVLDDIFGFVGVQRGQFLDTIASSASAIVACHGEETFLTVLRSLAAVEGWWPYRTSPRRGGTDT